MSETEQQAVGSCPICSGPLDASPTPAGNDCKLIKCGNCGVHVFTLEALESASSLSWNPQRQVAVAHAVWRRPPGDLVLSDHLESMRKTAELPAALHRLDLLVVLLATTAPPGGSIRSSPKRLKAKLGCESPEAAQWVVEQAVALGHVAQMNDGHLRLSAAGWRHFAEIERTGSRSKLAFMAMAYGPGHTENLYRSGLLHQAIADT